MRLTYLIRRHTIVCTLAIAATALHVSVSTATAQLLPAEWKLAAPRLEVGGINFDLDRVRGAALLSGGRVVVGDGGNSRVLVFSPSGALLKEFGREGEGPTEFANLLYLTAIGDTIVTWDSGRSRMVLWKPEGVLLRTTSLPTITRTIVDIKAVRSTSEFVATLRATRTRRGAGLFVDSFPLIVIDGAKQQQRPLGTHAWSFSYLHSSPSGATTYTTPFLGTTLVAASAGKVLMLPIGSATVQITRADGSRGAPVALPFASRAADRQRAQVYGDSIINSMSNNPDPATAARLRSVFGVDFPVPAFQALAQRAVTVGSTVWFQGYPAPRETTAAWIVVDAARERIAGRVSLPRNATVLGGDDKRVLVLLRDNEGVERVALYDLPAANR